MSAATIEPAVLDTDVVASTRGLTKRFGSVTALDDVTFDLRENTIYGLLGRNGAGKTTLMQVMTGQAYQTAGEVRVFGHTPHENTEVMTPSAEVIPRDSFLTLRSVGRSKSRTNSRAKSSSQSRSR